MSPLKTLASILPSILLLTVMRPDAVQAIMIDSSDILPSTILAHVNPWTIDQIADGNPMPGQEAASDVSPYNGFVSNNISGTITLNLVAEFDLTKFLLWNDVNVSAEGIKDFSLQFYDSSDSVIPVGFSATYQAPQGQLGVAEYVFDQVVLGVSRVDLVVLSVHDGSFDRIEIREVGFEVVPEPGTCGLFVLGLAAVTLRQRRQARFGNH
jgi:hypothetical protein